MRDREISRRRLLKMGTGYGASRRFPVTGTGQVSGELTIGIIGPYDLVERIMLSGPAAAGLPGQAGHGPVPARRLVAAAYRDEQEAPEKVVRLGGSALYAALLRACLGERPDLARASVDTLDRDEVEQAFDEIGVPARDVQVHADPASPAVLASFHERLWRRGQTSVAFTCLPSVAGKLSAARVPVAAIRPTPAAVRSGLRTAALLGWCRRLEDAQLAVAVVEVPTLRDAAARRGVPRQAREELRLTVNRFLVQQAQRIQATVNPIG